MDGQWKSSEMLSISAPISRRFSMSCSKLLMFLLGLGLRYTVFFLLSHGPCLAVKVVEKKSPELEPSVVFHGGFNTGTEPFPLVAHVGDQVFPDVPTGRVDVEDGLGGVAFDCARDNLLLLPDQLEELADPWAPPLTFYN